jgi:tol-pal system protein YbgF
MKTLKVSLAAAVVATGCSSLSPSTQDPVALRMTDLEARLIRIERVVENQSLVQLATEIEQLRSETSALRGELETLRFESEGNASRQRELYVDVDRRLQQLETTPQAFAPPPFSGGGAVGAAATPAPARPAGNDQQAYQAAFGLIETRKYDEANRAFTDFLAAYPTSRNAENAQYWLAETYYVRGDYTTALAEFRKVMETYPQSAKVPDALLKAGFCQAELGDRTAARSSLQEVMRQFPDTTAARLAAQRLDRLSQ